MLEVDEEYYDRDAEIIALSIDRTAHFLVKWTKNVQVHNFRTFSIAGQYRREALMICFFLSNYNIQNLSWPEIGTEFAKRAIETAPMDAYNETAATVQKAFEEHGSSRLVFCRVRFFRR